MAPVVTDDAECSLGMGKLQATTEMITQCRGDTTLAGPVLLDQAFEVRDIACPGGSVRRAAATRGENRYKELITAAQTTLALPGISVRSKTGSRSSSSGPKPSPRS